MGAKRKSGKKKDEKKITSTYLPLRQRLWLWICGHQIYFLIAINMIVFIWLMMPTSRPLYYTPGIINVESNEDLLPSKYCSLPYWRATPFAFNRRCLQAEYADDIYDLEEEIVRLKSCQKPEAIDLWTPPNKYFHFLPINISPAANKKIISFSLFGTSDRYSRNVIKIIRKYKEFLPNWTPRFWLGSDVPFLMINRLLNEEAEVVLVYQRKPENSTVKRPPGFHGMFWRFFIADDERVERYIVRDTDSMPIEREIGAVKQWISERTKFHIMRDHVEHSTEILGGMWGGRVDKMAFSASKEYSKALENGFAGFDGRPFDQKFLTTYLWPIAKHQMTCHISHRFSYVDSKGCKRFPIRREGKSYVGAVLETK